MSKIARTRWMIGGTVALAFFFFPWLFLNFQLAHQLPPTEGSVTLKHLDAPVTIIRDRWGVPHIHAKTMRDLFRAYGHAVAQDRLFQMDLMRRTGNGELSEIVGKSTLDLDILLRTLRIRAAMDEVWKKRASTMDPKMVERMEAFLDGVHQFVAEDRLPVEFTLLRYRPRPFTIPELMAVSGYMSLSFAESLLGDPLFSDLLTQFPADMVNELRQNTSPIPSHVSFETSKKVSLLAPLEKLDTILPPFEGSNAWAIAGWRSASGKPILANDPHISHSNPSVFYEAHLKCDEENFEVFGQFMPLIPFPAIGYTRDHAWSVTMSEVDDMDLYVETLNDKNEVLYKNKWVPLIVDEELIPVRGEKPIPLKIKRTPHGPLIDGTSTEVKGKHIAMKWMYHHPDNEPVAAFYGLSFAKTVTEFKTAVGHAAAPGLSMIWVSNTGDIAQWIMGKIPKRPKGIVSDLLLDGATGKDDYEETLPIDENPHLINPKEGQIVTTNYKPLGMGKNDYAGNWQPSDRYERIWSLLAEKKMWTASEMKPMQSDVRAMHADEMRPIMLASLSTVPEKDKALIADFAQWDFMSTTSSRGALLYHVWMHAILEEILLDELGETRFKSFIRMAHWWHFLKYVMLHPESRWWDDTNTPEKDTREIIIARAYGKAIGMIEKKLGKNRDKWNWGDMHTLTLVHPAGRVKPLNHFFNIGPRPISGSPNEVNNQNYARPLSDFGVTAGAAVRRVIDMATPEHSWSIIPSGNSGNVMSPHFDDQTPLYISGEFREVWLDEKQFESPTKRLELVPDKKSGF